MGIGRRGQTRTMRMSLLGGFQLENEGAELILPVGSQRLLAFLALKGRSIRRPLVAGTLWPVATEDHASSSLRSALARLHGGVKRRGAHLDRLAFGSRLSPTLPPSRSTSGELAHRVDRVPDLGWFAPLRSRRRAGKHDPARVRFGVCTGQSCQDGPDESAPVTDRFDVDVDLAVVVQPVHRGLDPLDGYGLALGRSLRADDDFIGPDLDDPVRSTGERGDRGPEEAPEMTQGIGRPRRFVQSEEPDQASLLA
jgi:hypothetical protein